LRSNRKSNGKIDAESYPYLSQDHKKRVFIRKRCLLEKDNRWVKRGDIIFDVKYRY